MGIIQKIRDGLKKTRDSLMKGLRRMLGTFTKIDEDLFEQLEETMIMGDMGADTAIQICDQLRQLVFMLVEQTRRWPAGVQQFDDLLTDARGIRSQHGRSACLQQVVVFVAVDVPELRALGLCHHHREWIVKSQIVLHAARNDLARFLDPLL